MLKLVDEVILQVVSPDGDPGQVQHQGALHPRPHQDDHKQTIDGGQDHGYQDHRNADTIIQSKGFRRKNSDTSIQTQELRRKDSDTSIETQGLRRKDSDTSIETQGFRFRYKAKCAQNETETDENRRPSEVWMSLDSIETDAETDASIVQCYKNDCKGH